LPPKSRRHDLQPRFGNTDPVQEAQQRSTARTRTRLELDDPADEPGDEEWHRARSKAST
jgi:hypothetical protein